MKTMPITKAHIAAVELSENLSIAIGQYQEGSEIRVSSGPEKIALNEMLRELLNQVLTIQGKLGRLAKAE